MRVTSGRRDSAILVKFDQTAKALSSAGKGAREAFGRVLERSRDVGSDLFEFGRKFPFPAELRAVEVCPF